MTDLWFSSALLPGGWSAGVRLTVFDGIITRVNFQEGQDVEQGQVLFQIEPRPYQAAYNQAKANLTRDSASAAYAAIEAVRYDSLVRKDYVTKEQAGQEEATAAAAAATVQSDAALLASAKFNLDNTVVRAPISGRTGNLLVRTGNLVHGAAATPLVLINQIHPILVQFAVPAINLPDIQKYATKGALAVTVYQVAAPTTTAPAGSTPAAADPGGDAPPGATVAPSAAGQSPHAGGRHHGAGAGNGTTAGSASPPAANGPPNLSATPGGAGQSTAGQDPSANANATDTGAAASNSTDNGSGGGPPGGGVYSASADVVPTGPGVSGSLSFVNNAIDTTTGTVLLKATFDNAKSELWPGEYVATVLRLYIQQDAIVVPPQAVMTGQQGTYVFVVDTKTNTAQQRPVVIQLSSDTLDVISSGLSAGEHVVTDGQSRLQNGAQVNVRALTNTTSSPAPSTAGKPVTAGHPRTTD